MEEQRNPESSPFFHHWRYDGNWLQKRLKVGPKSPVYKTADQAAVENWADRHGEEVVIGFADHNPDIMVQVEEDGEKKTITLPQWARDWEKTRPERYYSESPWVFRCVDIKARAFASVPWHVYKSEDQEADAYDENDEAVTLLREVNPEKNWHDLATALSKDLDLYGVAYMWKVRVGEGDAWERTEGEVKFLRRLNPSSVKMIADENGISHFEQRTSKISREYARENIIYLRDYDPENDYGSIAPMAAAEKAIKVEISANEHLADFFDNYAMPAVLMSSPNSVQQHDIKRLAAQYQREFKGKGKRGKTAFVGDGFEPKQLSYPPKELALEGIREEAHKAICSAFGVPMTLAGAQEAANYATMDVQRRSLYTETIIPRARYIQGVINAELMSEFEGERFFRFEPDKLEVMQENKLDKAKWVALLAEHRVIKPEVLAVEMGYTEEDAPEPQSNPFLDTQSAPEQAEKAQSVNIAPEGLKTLTALTKYRRKAKNRIKDERNPVCDFTSKYVPAGMVKAIMVDLEDAETLDDVDDIFEQYGLEPHAE